MKTIKNSILHFCIHLLKALGLKTIKPSSQEKRILIVSTTGLGDTLWATPAIASIKNSYPNAYLGVLTSPVGIETLKHSPYIDEFFLLQRSRLFKLPSLIKKLRQARFDTALIFHVSQRVALPLVVLSGIKNIYGTPSLTKDFDIFLTAKAGIKNKEHEILRRLHLANLIPLKKRSYHLEVYPCHEDFDKAKNLLHDFSNSFVIALHPGSKDLFKRWPQENFIALGNLLKNHHSQIFITGSTEEYDLCEKIAQKIDGAINLAGQLSPLEIAAFLSLIDLFITNDTGPMHLSLAVKTKTLALFCPTNPTLCGPLNAPYATVIEKKPTCSPCIGKKCQEPFCLRQISVKEVYNKAVTLLNLNLKVYEDVSLS